MAFLWLVLGIAHAQTCATPPDVERFVHNFSNGTGLNIPSPSGTEYTMPERTFFDAFERAFWLQQFYNSLGTERDSQESDALILADDWVAHLMSQDDLVNEVENAKITLKSRAREVIPMLECGQDGIFWDRGSKLVKGNEGSYSVHLAIGSFTLYWDAGCSFTPLQCCADNERCESGKAHELEVSCTINYTIYDNYNFSSKSGTGGTGWLKRANPLGWAGTSFYQFGYSSEKYELSPYACVPESECCDPSAAEPEPENLTAPDPVSDPVPEDVDCPLCTPIHAALEEVEAQIEEVEAELEELGENLKANLEMQEEVRTQLEGLRGEANEGGWTASGTNPETGITKAFDATQGDGQVHVTVTDKSGGVVDEYTYPRSSDPARAGARAEEVQDLLEALEADQGALEDQIEAKDAQLKELRQTRDQLQAELHACTCDTDSERAWFVGPMLGFTASPGSEPEQWLTGAIGGWEVIPGGSVVAAPEIQRANGHLIFTFPVGYQHEFALSNVLNGLSVYPRGTIGYGLQRVSFSLGNGTRYTDVSHFGAATAVAGASLAVADRIRVFVEPVGLNLAIRQRPGAGYRAAAGATFEL